MSKSQKEGKECCEYCGSLIVACSDCTCHKEPQKEVCCEKCMNDVGNFGQCWGSCKCHAPKQEQGTGWEGEKYGIWKIISEMLDHPIDSGIYHTSKCYKDIDSVIDELISRAEQAGYERGKREGLEIGKKIYEDFRSAIKEQ